MASNELENLILDFGVATRRYMATQDAHVGELRNPDALAYVHTWEVLRNRITATETQRDQAITERDAARRRLAVAEARIDRLQDGINAVTATAHAIGHHTGWIEPCISEFLLPGDPDPVAPDDAQIAVTLDDDDPFGYRPIPGQPPPAFDRGFSCCGSNDPDCPGDHPACHMDEIAVAQFRASRGEQDCR